MSSRYAMLESADENGEFLCSDELQEPSWEELEAWLRSLDGVQRSAVSLYRPPLTFVEVARVAPKSRPEGYVVTAYVDGESMVLVGAQADEGSVIVRRDEVSAAFAVSFELAKQVMRLYFEHGKLDRAAGWMRVHDVA